MINTQIIIKMADSSELIAITSGLTSTRESQSSNSEKRERDASESQSYTSQLIKINACEPVSRSGAAIQLQTNIMANFTKNSTKLA